MVTDDEGLDGEVARLFRTRSNGPISKNSLEIQIFTRTRSVI